MGTMTDQAPISARDFDADCMEDVESAGLWMRVACFDNGGETADRYTVLVEADPPWGQGDEYGAECFTYYASSNPYHPQGVGMTGEAWAIGDSETDLLVDFASLPAPVRGAVWSAAGSHWMLGTPNGYVELNYDFAAGQWIARFGPQV